MGLEPSLGEGRPFQIVTGFASVPFHTCSTVNVTNVSFAEIREPENAASASFSCSRKCERAAALPGSPGHTQLHANAMRGEKTTTARAKGILTFHIL